MRGHTQHLAPAECERLLTSYNIYSIILLCSSQTERIQTVNLGVPVHLLQAFRKPLLQPFITPPNMRMNLEVWTTPSGSNLV